MAVEAEKAHITYEERAQKKKKRKKEKKRGAEVKEESHFSVLLQCKHKSKKKKSARKKENTECEEVQAGGLRVKKKKLRANAEDLSASCVVPADCDSEFSGVKSLKKKDKPKRLKKKKRKNISSGIVTRDQEEDQGFSTDKISKVICKSEDARTTSKEHELVPKKKSKNTAKSLKALGKETKKKKKRRRKENLCQEDQDECRTSLTEISERTPVGDAQDSEMKRARKEKKAARPGDGRATTDGALGLSDQMDAGEETRQRKRKVTEFTAENGVERKKEKRKVAEKQEMEKERMAPKFGQWSTASFENPDQQMKFFRLMGGFKKSNQPEALPPAGTEKANVALTKQGEQTLKQGLQNEFEKAQNLKQHRGAGLGFQSAASKIFYIDKNMSRSAKFED